MDFRKPLFQLEQISPYLARKFLSLTQYRFVPVVATMGLEVKNISDLNVEIGIPFSRQNRDEHGVISNVVIWAAGDYCCRAFLSRHLPALSYELNLSNGKIIFTNKADSSCRAQIKVVESEREVLLRKFNSGQSATWEVIVKILNSKDQQVGDLQLNWDIVPKFSPSLPRGSL